MKKIIGITNLVLLTSLSFGQAKKTELYDLVKKFMADSTGYGSFGDWAVGSPKTYPVKWQEDRVTMSDDMKINFFRNGTADIAVNGNSYEDAKNTSMWNVMLKGPRSGFTSFTISSPASANILAKPTIDSLFGQKKYSYKLLQSCDKNPASGFYYYQVKIPKKDPEWIKLAWTCKSGNCIIIMDCYGEASKENADLVCPK